MRILAAIFAVLMLAGCQTLSEATGTTKEDRCANYRTILENVKVVHAVKPTDDRAKRIALYEGLIATNCPAVK